MVLEEALVDMEAPSSMLPVVVCARRMGWLGAPAPPRVGAPTGLAELPGRQDRWWITSRSGRKVRPLVGKDRKRSSPSISHKGVCRYLGHFTPVTPHHPTGSQAKRSPPSHDTTLPPVPNLPTAPSPHLPTAHVHLEPRHSQVWAAGQSRCVRAAGRRNPKRTRRHMRPSPLC